MKLVLVGLLTSVLVGAVNASPAQQTAPVKVKEAGFLVTTIAPVFIAIQNGYFLDEGLDLEYVEIDSGALGAMAITTGLAQFTDLGVSDVINLQAQGKDPILVYSIVNSLTMNLVVRNEVLEKLGISRQSPIEDRMKALKGMTIGITRPGAPTDLYPRYMMQSVGLNPDTDASFVAIGGGSALLAALESGQIDAYLLSPPTPFIAEQDGKGTILIMNSEGDVPKFRDFAFTSTAVSKAWAEANPTLVEGYSRALHRAYQFMVEHNDEAIQILHDKYFPDTDLATLKISINATMSAMKPDGHFSEAAIQNQVDVLKAIGALDSTPDTAEGGIWTNQWNPDLPADMLTATAEATAAS